MNTSVMVFSGILLAGMIMVTGCTSNHPVKNAGFEHLTIETPVEGIPSQFTESDNGKTYEIPRNAGVFVLLTESPADNYLWNASVSPGLKIADDYYLPNLAGPRTDINGSHAWHVYANGTGKQSFHAAYYRGSQKFQDYSLTLQINP
jgi:predicted secreted protein